MSDFKKAACLVGVLLSTALVWELMSQPACCRMLSTKKLMNKNYLMLLIAFPYPWPEFVELTLSDNGTFSLKSDFYKEPARGTYESSALVLKGTGTSVQFFDPDYDELVSLTYDFVALPIGFRGFFMLGAGLRNIKYYSDNQTTSENFIFEGPGFQRTLFYQHSAN